MIYKIINNPDKRDNCQPVFVDLTILQKAEYYSLENVKWYEIPVKMTQLVNNLPHIKSLLRIIS